MDKEKYMPMLRAIQEVKEQHHVSSEDAYRYLKDSKQKDTWLNITRLPEFVYKLGLDDTAETRRLLFGITEFRFELLRCLLFEAEAELGASSDYSTIGADMMRCFGSEKLFIRKFCENRCVKESLTLQYPDLVNRFNEFFFDRLKEVFGLSSSEIIQQQLTDIILPAFVAIIDCLFEQKSEGVEDPFSSGDISEYDMFERLFELLERAFAGETWSKNHLEGALENIVISHWYEHSVRVVERFFAPEVLYWRMEREQILHDIHRQENPKIRKNVEYTRKGNFSRHGWKNILIVS